MDEDGYTCDTCRGPLGRCGCEADGYECPKCGYVPTWSELQLAVCPDCREHEEDA